MSNYEKAISYGPLDVFHKFTIRTMEGINQRTGETVTMEIGRIKMSEGISHITLSDLKEVQPTENLGSNLQK